MKKILILTLFLAIFANAVELKNISAKYDISFGVFGKVGDANAWLKFDNKKQNYEIELKAKTIGMANSLSGNRIERFNSKGFVRGVTLFPKIYTHTVEREKRGKTVVQKKIYTFDYEKKQIHYQKFKGEKDSLKLDTDEILSYFASNDLLSLFFNFSHIKAKSDKFYVTAVGAKNETGRIDVIIPNGSKKTSIQNALETTFSPYIVFINQKIFASKRGELYMSLNEKGYANRAILKDVLFFGDIHARLVE